MRLTPELRAEYEQLFDSCEVRLDLRHDVDELVARIVAGRTRYEFVDAETGVPWHVVACVHSLEASLDFRRHLHNGDPLVARTKNVPAGRPLEGEPPYTWEASAVDAVTMRLDLWEDWSITGTLYRLEAFNGWGYRGVRPPTRSPYLWSFSQHYTAGKFIADGKYSPTAVSQQCGAGVLLRKLVDRDLVELDAALVCGAVLEDRACVRRPHSNREPHRDEFDVAWS